MSPITPVGMPLEALASPAIKPAGMTNEPPGASFANVLGDAIEGLGASMAGADQRVTRLAAGEDGDLHEVMVALEATGLELQTALQVRNKVLDAYKEIMSMPL